MEPSVRHLLVVIQFRVNNINFWTARNLRARFVRPLGNVRKDVRGSFFCCVLSGVFGVHAMACVRWRWRIKQFNTSKWARYEKNVAAILRCETF